MYRLTVSVVSIPLVPGVHGAEMRCSANLAIHRTGLRNKKHIWLILEDVL